MNALKHHRKRTLTLAFLFALTLTPSPYTLSPVFAGGPGTTSAQILKTDISPRAMGMGGSFVAVADDISAVNYNPAGLGQFYLPEATAMYLSGFEDSKLQYLAFGMPLPITGFAGLEKPGVALSAIFTQNGRFTERREKADRSVEVGDTVDAETNSVLALTYGEKIYSAETKIEGYSARFDQYLGLSAKYISSELLEKYSAKTFALDAGWLVREANSGLAFGAALSNYGGGLKYLKETSPLPTILRLGLSYERPTVMDQSVLAAVESDFYTTERLKSLRFGLEYHFEKIFNFRLGYKAMEDNKGPTMGLGIHHEGFSIDFAMSLSNEVFNMSQVSFSYKFTGWRMAEYKKTVRYKDQEESRTRPENNLKPARKTPIKSKPRNTAPASKGDDFYWIY